MERILAAAERLGDFPHLGHAGIARDTYEWPVTGLPYSLLHEVREDQEEVVILAVFHGARTGSEVRQILGEASSRSEAAQLHVPSPPSLSVFPPIFLSFASTAPTSSSSEGFSFAASASARDSAVVASAGRSVEPRSASVGSGFSLAARWTSRSRSIWEQSPSVTGSSGLRFVAFQWVRSRIAWIVDLVVPTSRMIWLSLSSGWLRTSQRMAFGRSWRRDTGVWRGPFFCLASGRRTFGSATCSR